jgi:hypothetical protein
LKKRRIERDEQVAVAAQFMEKAEGKQERQGEKLLIMIIMQRRVCELWFP